MYAPLLQSESAYDEEKVLAGGQNPPWIPGFLIAQIFHLLIQLFKIIIKAIYAVLTPSFMHYSVGKRQRPADLGVPQSPSSTFSTDWLDGMRGVAAFIVFFYHFASSTHSGLKISYGTPQEHPSVFQLPIVRIIHQGQLMVPVFFVISGYALSVSFLKLMHKREYNTFFTKLSSSVFRRALRLVLPSIVANFCQFLALVLGLIHRPKHKSTFWADVQELREETSQTMEIFSWTTVARARFYNPQLWTIPVELRGSLLLFVTLLGLARAKPAVRLGTIAGLHVFCMAKSQWPVGLFMAGAILAEVSLLCHHITVQREAGASLVIGDIQGLAAWYPTNKKRLRIAAKISLVIMLIVGLYLGSYPGRRGAEAPEFNWLGKATGNRGVKIWLAIGAILIMTSISFMPRCQAIFETAPTLYLGRISFSLYLTHHLMNWMVGGRLVKFMVSIVGKQDWVHYEIAWLLATSIHLPVSIWVADVFWKLVEVPSVKLAKTMESKCCTLS